MYVNRGTYMIANKLFIISVEQQEGWDGGEVGQAAPCSY